MDLYFLLRCCAAAMGFSFALLAGKNEGILGVSIGLVVGLAAGFIGYGGMRVLTAEKLIDRILVCKKTAQFILGYIALFAAIVWIVFSAFLGSWLTKLAIHICK